MFDANKEQVRPDLSAANTEIQQLNGRKVVKFSINDEDLHVMPGQYLPAEHARVKSANPNRKFFILIGGLALFLAAVIGGLLLYLKAQVPAPTLEVNLNTNRSEFNANANANVNTNTAPTTAQARDLQRLADINKIRAALGLYFDAQSIYPQVLSGLSADYLSEELKDPLSGQRYSYQLVPGGQSYILSFVLESQVPFENTVLEPGLHQIGPQGLVETGVNQNTNVNGNSNGNVNSTPPATDLNVDSDRDKLTTAEETSFQTDKNNSDTDGDGFLDGEEILNLYSPIGANKAFLNVSGLVASYENKETGYVVWTPQDWIFRGLDIGNREVIFNSPNGDSVTINSETNDQQLTIEEWYSARNPGVNASTLRTQQVGGYKALRSQDGLTVWLTNGQMIFTIAYQKGNNGAINYPTVLELMLKTFNLGV